jgi:hypothetical protein
MNQKAGLQKSHKLEVLETKGEEIFIKEEVITNVE